ncbi:MAG: hypothetical protein AAGF11_38710 [Myxococcota bacterium]
MGLQVWLLSQPSSFLHSGAGPVLLLPLLLPLSLPLLLPLLAVVSTLVIDSVVVPVPVGWSPTVSLSPGGVAVLGPVETGSVLAPVASACGGGSGGKPMQLAKNRGTMRV